MECGIVILKRRKLKLNKAEEFRKRTSVIFLTLIVSFLHAVSSFFVEDSEIFRNVLGKSSGQIVSVFFFGGLQLILLIRYFKYFISKQLIKLVVFIFFILIVISVSFGLLYVFRIQPLITKPIFNTATTFIQLLATGLISLIVAISYKNFKEYLPEAKEEEIFTDTIENKPYVPLSPVFKKRMLWATIIIICISVMLMLFKIYKLSGLTFWIATLFLGYQVRWNIVRFQNIAPFKVWILVTISCFMGFYGSLWDWFTGFMFYLASFVMLFLTNSYKVESVIRFLFMMFCMLFAFICLLFHFLFSLKYY